MINKSTMNIKTGEWAESQLYFDVAISRYYYSAFQKIIYVLKRIDAHTVSKVGDNHNVVIEDFLRCACDGLSPEQINNVKYIYKIKSARVHADYYEKKITDRQEYEKVFKNYYLRFNRVIDQIISKGE